MFYVPLYIEALRSRPALTFWGAMLAQAALWLAVPLLFYAAPPSELARLLAVGHALPLSGDFGPPLAYWLAEIAFRVAGLLGVYGLAQLCVIGTYWCVFALGREIVGASHAAMAVLLMVGILVFTVPTPNFGPPILAMALWAAVLLFCWRAVIKGRRRSWYPLGGAAALLLLTSDAALILLGTLALFTAMSARGRAVLGALEARIVAAGLAVVLVAHLFWLNGAGEPLAATLQRLREPAMAGANTAAWLRLLATLVLAHAGLAILVVLASGWPRSGASPASAIVRPPVAPSAITFVKVFALLPALLATAVAVVIGQRLPIGGAAPLLVLSGLAVVVAAGDSIALRQQRTLGFAWAGLLVVPALLIPAAIVLLPWISGSDLAIAQPAAAMGRFFADSFERRTGHPLAVVSGDARIAALVALTAPSRPQVYFATDPEHSHWVTAQDISEKGAVVVWSAAPTTPEPPPAIKARFPDLIAEVPETFERPVRGRLPPLRIGWGMIRPASGPAPPAPPPAPH
ncbi:MAG TPA: glycosyltransferase family 39 protein [Xanthobacteraceae bacterium]|nr:glycosyltransferase family 39 protein [Xanthobacteraceae bacterium]